MLWRSSQSKTVNDWKFKTYPLVWMEVLNSHGIYIHTYIINMWPKCAHKSIQISCVNARTQLADVFNIFTIYQLKWIVMHVPLRNARSTIHSQIGVLITSVSSYTDRIWLWFYHKHTHSIEIICAKISLLWLVNLVKPTDHASDLIRKNHPYLHKKGHHICLTFFYFFVEKFIKAHVKTTSTITTILFFSSCPFHSDIVINYIESTRNI